MKKGETYKLDYTKDVEHRIYIGLSWDPRNAQTYREKLQTATLGLPSLFMGKTDIDDFDAKVDEQDHYLAQRSGILGLFFRNHYIDKASRENKAYDLDLMCFTRTSDGEIRSIVTPDNYQMSNAEKSIYHSGDDFDGGGGGDDEIIYVELKNIAPEVEEIFFAVTSKNDFDFTEVETGRLRIVDSLPEEELFSYDLDAEADTGDNIFTFCRLYRAGEDIFVEAICEYSSKEEWGIAV